MAENTRYSRVQTNPRILRLQRAFQRAWQSNDIEKARLIQAEMRRYREQLAETMRTGTPAQQNRAFALMQGLAVHRADTSGVPSMFGAPNVANTPQEMLMAWGVYSGLADKFVEYQRLVAARHGAGAGADRDRADWGAGRRMVPGGVVDAGPSRHRTAGEAWDGDGHRGSPNSTAGPGRRRRGRRGSTGRSNSSASPVWPPPRQIARWRALRLETNRLIDEWREGRPGGDAAEIPVDRLEAEAAAALGMTAAGHRQLSELFTGETSPFRTIQLRTVGEGAGTYGGGLFTESGVYAVDYATGQVYDPSGNAVEHGPLRRRV